MNLPKLLRLLFPAFLSVAALLSVSCRERRSSGFLERDAEEVKDLTVPGDSSNLQPTVIQSGLWSRKISWEFDCKLLQAQYLEWVGERLKGKFKTARSSRDEAVFTKNLDGDAETVVIRTRTDGENVHVRVEVSVLPD